MWNNRISEGEVARILNLIDSPPNIKPHPSEPNYAEVFDGGERRYETGITRYSFSDKTKASVGVVPFLSITITFPDGKEVRITQS